MAKKINIISIDLGTKNLIIRVNEQTVYDQPSAIVFDTESGQVFIGEEAITMRDRTPANKIYKEPLVNGVISDVNALIALLTEIFINIVQVHNKKIWKQHNFWKNSVVLVGIPSKIYRLDEEVIKEALQGKHIARIPVFSERYKKYEVFSKVMRAERIIIVPSVKLAAIGAGLSIWDSQGVFLLDIGGGTSDCSIIALGDIILQDSITNAGNSIDEELIRYLEEKHYLSVTKEEAEAIKMRVGLPNIEAEKTYANDGGGFGEIDTTITIYGKSLKTGNPGKIVLEKDELEKIIAVAFEPIVELCKTIIYRSGTVFAKTIQQTGLVLTGGGALLKNIDSHLRHKLAIANVWISTEPDKCTIKGVQIFEMHKKDLYEKGFIRPSR